MTIARSPLATIPKLIDFPAAMQAVIEGKMITKDEWNNPEEYCCLRAGSLMIYRFYKWHRWTINDGDMLGKDWIVLDGGE